MITDTVNSPEEVVEQLIKRMSAPAPLTAERHQQMRQVQSSALKQRSIYPTVEGNWKSEQQRTCTEKKQRAIYQNVREKWRLYKTKTNNLDNKLKQIGE